MKIRLSVTGMTKEIYDKNEKGMCLGLTEYLKIAVRTSVSITRKEFYQHCVCNISTG